MTLVKIKPPKAAQFNIGGRFVNGESVLELTDTEIKNHKDVILEVIKLKKENEIPKPPKPIPEQGKYTKESLQEIYDKKGIDALRNIAKKFKVKFRSIEEGIREILEDQK